VFRQLDAEGRLKHDVIGLRSENFPGAEPLLKKVMDQGKAAGSPSLEESRSTFFEEFERLPAPFKAIRNPPHYPVEFSAALEKLRARVEREVSS
jgi:nicotinate phosphoribosyltransferase